ncbi:hypothetical protein CLU79DRAFT_698377 [Phycomyces nitens]|nr:hypothetical protein CLU79DRAFT_698377 [Phycomyces nitens]
METPSFVVFSGGSACNFIAPAFQSISSDVCYVLGISDNGGSTSELLRVLGGPSIGDIRSRLIRLINVNHDSVELRAIKDLLNYRLPSGSQEHAILDEWSLIVEGRHRLWNNISTEKKEAIRGFLVLFNFEILKRAYKHFNYRNGSIGNFFLTGARLFFGSLEAAIFLFSSITAIREPTHVVPVINTNHTAAIAARLENGEVLHGQCEISHPGQNGTANLRLMNPIDAFSRLALPGSPDPYEDDRSQTNDNLVFSKSTKESLPAAIDRVYYINEYGQEIYPIPNPKVIVQLATSTTLVYSIGSLYTSILPCLILRGVGNAIARSPTLRHKILMLNGHNDRETGDFCGIDFIKKITEALNESQLIDARRQYYDRNLPHVTDQNTDLFNVPPFPSDLIPFSPPRTFITHLIYLSNSRIKVDVESIERLGITCIEIEPEDGVEPGYSSVKLEMLLRKLI